MCVQALSKNVKDILKLKKSFSQLSLKKIEDINKMINNTGKLKPHINITTKKLFCKQIIISKGKENITKFMTSSEKYITNINHTLKSIKSDVFIIFIHFDYYGFIVTSNKVTSPSDIDVVEDYIRNINSIDSNNIQTACLF